MHAKLLVNSVIKITANLKKKIDKEDRIKKQKD